MRRHLVHFFLASLCIISLSTYVIFINIATASNSAITISEDVAAGNITVESANIKGVWHYKTTAAENNNQGGGNIYELYYKPSDPGATRNLVSFNNMHGWGNGQSTAVWVGIGGIGATTLYATDVPPAPQQTNNFGDLIGDNNLSGTLVSHSAGIDQNGNAVLTFSYRVHSQSTGKDWYQVEKKWTVEPGGSIHLGINWTILSTGYFSEPALRTAWSYSAGWDQFVKYGRDWMQPAQPKYLLGASGISTQTSNCWDSLNRFVPDWYSLTGSPVAPTVTMAPEDNGLGFSALGSYLLGVSAWGSPANPVQEECSEVSPYSGAQSINWMAAWGGNPPQGNRYAKLDAGRSWSDSYRIDFSQDPPNVGPLVSAVTVQPANNGSARVSWTTNMPADSTVEVSTNMDDAGSWQPVGHDATLTSSHTVVATGLSPGISYSLRVKSRDAAGTLSVSSGYAVPISGAPPVLALNNTDVYWASYADYQNRLLSVGFVVHNESPAVARSVSITAASATKGVSVTSSLPAVIGDLAAGMSSQLTLVYHVPAGTWQFMTQLYSTAIGSNGELLHYPSS
ncbi:MAG: fibronectin type III domain-containing protein [Thermoleophilia bacterium]